MPDLSQEIVARLADVAALTQAMLAVPCIGCGGPATCWGCEAGTPRLDPMCDDCCGHGGEDGWCTRGMLEEGDRTKLVKLAITLFDAGWQPDGSSADAYKNAGEAAYRIAFPESEES